MGTKWPPIDSVSSSSSLLNPLSSPVEPLEVEGETQSVSANRRAGFDHHAISHPPGEASCPSSFPAAGIPQSHAPFRSPPFWPPLCVKIWVHYSLTSLSSSLLGLTSPFLSSRNPGEPLLPHRSILLEEELMDLTAFVVVFTGINRAKSKGVAKADAR
jgi:hypothetical protein